MYVASCDGLKNGDSMVKAFGRFHSDIFDMSVLPISMKEGR